jgi:Fe-S cluster biogenesis protein NfuA
MSEIEHIEKQIITVLEKIRPFLNRDGGDVEFVKYENGIVYVKMIGACAGCDLIDSTLQDGIATLLMEEVPGVVGVRNIEETVVINEEI